jgi:hypothetical protein
MILWGIAFAVPQVTRDVQPRQRISCDGLSSQIEFPLSGQEYQLLEETWLGPAVHGSLKLFDAIHSAFDRSGTVCIVSPAVTASRSRRNPAVTAIDVVDRSGYAVLTWQCEPGDVDPLIAFVGVKDSAPTGRQALGHGAAVPSAGEAAITPGLGSANQTGLVGETEIDAVQRRWIDIPGYFAEYSTASTRFHRCRRAGRATEQSFRG